MSYVYRFLDKEYNCLYVGFTDRQTVFQRFGEHFGTNGHLGEDVYSQVARIDIKEYPTKEGGLKAEKKYIKKYTPVYNEVHNKNRGRNSWSNRPMKIVIQEDWQTLVTMDGMSEIPKFVRALQYMYLGGFIIFGIASMILMVSRA